MAQKVVVVRGKGCKVGCKMSPRQANVAKHCDGTRTSGEIAELCSEGAKYVQQIMLQWDLPRLARAPRAGKHNPAYKEGRQIDRDGYAYVAVPKGHRFYGVRKRMREHRLVMEQTLGRGLGDKEVVDHIDGLKLHNDPKNLRVFENNGEHLKATLTGLVPSWSSKGIAKVEVSQSCGGLRLSANAKNVIVDRYRQMKKRGDARLLEILRAHLALEVSSPHLLGTNHYLVEVGVDPSDDLQIELALLELCSRWELDHTQYIP